MLYKGEGAADLDSCIYYANMVINAHPLVDDYHELFRHDLGDFSNEKTTENVLNAVFSESGDNYRYGVRALTFFLSVIMQVTSMVFLVVCGNMAVSQIKVFVMMILV